MRFQSNIDITTLMPCTTTTTAETSNDDMKGMLRIPRNEQDEDLYRNEIPGRDPVTQVRGSG